MTAKEIEVTCPCCDTRLFVDVLTQKVMKTAKPHEIDDTGRVKLDENRWDQASNRVAERNDVGVDKFDKALDAERKRSDRLDDLFRKASDKVSQGEDEDAASD